MDVEPSSLLDVISVTPAIRPNWRSSGVATAEAITSGLAPGRFARNVNGGILHLRNRSDGQILERKNAR